VTFYGIRNAVPLSCKTVIYVPFSDEALAGVAYSGYEMVGSGFEGLVTSSLQ
jgi:hypothetical protein